MRYFLLFSITLTLLNINCFPIQRIIPLKYPDQKEILSQGEVILFSQKQNHLIICSKDGVIKKGRGTIFFALQNTSFNPLNLYFHNINISDQYGRKIYIIPKKVLLSEEQTKANWKIFASALATACETVGAQDAGTINYRTNTYSDYSINTRTTGYNGGYNLNGNISGSTFTSGSIHCEALRQQAMDRVNVNSYLRLNQIDQELTETTIGMNNFYFDSNTLFSGDVYETRFQFEIPRKIEKELRNIFISFDLGNERHTFCFRC